MKYGRHMSSFLLSQVTRLQVPLHLSRFINLVVVLPNVQAVDHVLCPAYCMCYATNVQASSLTVDCQSRSEDDSEKLVEELNELLMSLN